MPLGIKCFTVFIGQVIYSFQLRVRPYMAIRHPFCNRELILLALDFLMYRREQFSSTDLFAGGYEKYIAEVHITGYL